VNEPFTVLPRRTLDSLCLILPCLVLAWLGLACFTFSCLFLSCRVVSCRVVSCRKSVFLSVSCLCLIHPLSCQVIHPLSCQGLASAPAKTIPLARASSAPTPTTTAEIKVFSCPVLSCLLSCPASCPVPAPVLFILVVYRLFVLSWSCLVLFLPFLFFFVIVFFSLPLSCHCLSECLYFPSQKEDSSDRIH
jgi:hypothetical protein